MLNEEGDLEYSTRYRNEHGTGYDLIVSNPIEGMVDIQITQVVCHEPDEVTVSLSIPHEAALDMMRAMAYGVNIAAAEKRRNAIN
jgi:hypothetical protein